VRGASVRGRRGIHPGLLVPVLLVPVLLVPVSPSRAQSHPAKPQSAQKPAPGAKAAEAKPATCTHTVRHGESVSRIAHRYHVTRAAVISVNHLADPNALRLGQRLHLPGCHAPTPTATGQTRLPEIVDGTVVKRVGPRRVLTEMVLNEPDFQGERIPLVWPAEGPVISTFGQRPRGWHAGIDISAEAGSQVFAAAPGTVLYSGWMRSYGQVVKLRHASGFITLYAHNLTNLVEEGEEVEAGQVIATVGRSGHATGPHVHFEVQRDGRAYNPLHLLEPSEKSPVLEGDVAASSSTLDPHE